MNHKKTVGILTGGDSVERGVSFLSCENVIGSINHDKYNVWVRDVDTTNTDWIQTLIDAPPDIIFSTLHGGRGENGSMQGLLHYLGIPFVGSKVLASSVCMDKKIAKTIMSANHIPTITHIYIKRTENLSIYSQSLEMLGYPLIIKPNRGGSSIGIRVCRDYAELSAAAEKIIEVYDDDLLVEKYIQGKEIACCILETKQGRDVCIMDIDTNGGIFDYDGKYNNSSNVCLTHIPQYMQDMIRAIALKAFDKLKCKGYAVVDMIIKEEQVYVIEVNTLPGLTSTSLIPKAAEILGMSFGEFIDKLIEFELDI